MIEADAAGPHLYLWRIHGRERHESGGGDETVYAITSGPRIFPDPDSALGSIRKGWEWEALHSIVLVAIFPVCWLENESSEFLDSLTGSIGHAYGRG